jgi:hypothetical protein
MVRTCHRYLQYSCCEVPNAVQMRDAEYVADGEHKFHEVRTHCHKRAIVLTACKLIRRVVRLLTPYQPDRLLLLLANGFATPRADDRRSFFMLQL